MDELVKNLRGRSQFLLPHYGEETSYDSDLMKQAADAIEELTRENESLAKSVNEASEILRRHWIPVTERLPEGNTNVLCCGANGGMFVGWTGSNVFEGKVRAFVHGGSGRNITHWMPLPKPPKESEP